MVLVDTSVWINFLREGNDQLKSLLHECSVYTHPIIVGELSCGNIKNRTKFMALINDLPFAKESTHSEVIQFIESNKVFDKGVGFSDMHILCSAILSNIPLWTHDKRLSLIAKQHKPRF